MNYRAIVRLSLMFVAGLYVVTAECYDARRLGGTTFPRRKPKKSLYQQRVDSEKKQQEQVRQKDKSNREKAKIDNPKRSLSIKTFCGYTFGEAGEDKTEPCRKPFGGYKTATLKYYEGKGLSKITVINNDPDRIKDVRKEVERIVKMCEKNFNILFTKGVSSRNNAEKESHKVYHPGWGNSFVNTETKAATHWWYSASEEFRNFTITVKGEKDIGGEMFVELSILHEVFK